MSDTIMLGDRTFRPDEVKTVSAYRDPVGDGRYRVAGAWLMLRDGPDLAVRSAGAWEAALPWARRHGLLDPHEPLATYDEAGNHLRRQELCQAAGLSPAGVEAIALLALIADEDVDAIATLEVVPDYPTRVGPRESVVLAWAADGPEPRHLALATSGLGVVAIEERRGDERAMGLARLRHVAASVRIKECLGRFFRDGEPDHSHEPVTNPRPVRESLLQSGAYAM